MTGIICTSSHPVFAFWTQLGDPEKHPQHWLITELVQWPDDELFQKHGSKLADWSEEPDRKKRPWGHGDEEGRARRSFRAAVKHYVNYLKDKSNEDELDIAVACLGRAYHYFEDVGDFSESRLFGPKNIRLRNAVTEQLRLMNLDPGLFRKEIEAKKKGIPPDIEGILKILGDRKTQRKPISYTKDAEIRDRILLIVASLEQVNEDFLKRVNDRTAGFRSAGVGTTTLLGQAPSFEPSDSPGPASDQGFGPAETGRTEHAGPPPSWSPPLSHGDQIGARAQPAGPADYRWYVMCDRANGTVVFGKDWDPARHVILAGPLEGPRTAQHWIAQNCPAAHCNARGACTAGAPSTAAAGSGWYVMCNRHDGSVVYGRNPDVARQSVMAGPLPGPQDATGWIAANCPSARCTQTGACATVPGIGGSWYVLCNRDDGNVVMSKNVDPSRQIVWQGNLRGEWDARQWISMNCPAARCDRNGRCTQQAAPIPVPVKPQQGPAIGQRPGGPSDFCNEQYRRFQDALRNNQARYANDILQASRGCWFYGEGTSALQQAQSKPPVQSKPQTAPLPGKPGPVVTPTPAPTQPSAACNRRARCESWDAKGRRWIHNSGYGGGFGRVFEVGGSCMGERQIRCWDDCDKKWRCEETRY